jgi:predicted phosphoadenosine phosphosulfate sulfurtransferase
MPDRIYLKQTVFDAALDRIRRLYDEFDNIQVCISGGKDSTVTLNLTLMVAEERGRLPVDVLFIDQEAEWKMVIDHIRRVFADIRIKPCWLQCPIKIFNATSTKEPWLMCWEPGAEWMREREPDSVHENLFGTDRFAQLFRGILEHYWPTAPACHISGVRAEESPARARGLTTYATYKDITWGKKQNAKLGHYAFYPIYDWSYTDVWKAIHDNAWDYCKIYDHMYQYGVPVRAMRVSNLHHETAVHTLFYLQEVESDTWERLTKRIQGINTAGVLGAEQYWKPTELPNMFVDWFEYRDYLLENLIEDVLTRDRFRKTFAAHDDRYGHDDKAMADLVSCEISTILVNDFHFTKLSTFNASHIHSSKNRGARSGRRD